MVCYGKKLHPLLNLKQNKVWSEVITELFERATVFGIRLRCEAYFCMLKIYFSILVTLLFWKHEYSFCALIMMMQQYHWHEWIPDRLHLYLRALVNTLWQQWHFAFCLAHLHKLSPHLKMYSYILVKQNKFVQDMSWDLKIE